MDFHIILSMRSLLNKQWHEFIEKRVWSWFATLCVCWVIFWNERPTVSVATLDLLISSVLVLEFSLSPTASNIVNGSRKMLKLSRGVKCTFWAYVKWFVIVCVQTERKEDSSGWCRECQIQKETLFYCLCCIVYIICLRKNGWEQISLDFRISVRIPWSWNVS